MEKEKQNTLFDNLVTNLRNKGYEVTVTSENKYRFARIFSKNIKGGDIVDLFF